MLLSALGIATIGSASWAAIETATAFAMRLSYLDDNIEVVPLVMGAFARASLTYISLSVPVMLVIAFILSIVIRRTRVSFAVSVLVSLFVFLFGFLIAPVDLELAHATFGFEDEIGWIAGLVGAVSAFLVVHLIISRFRGRLLTVLAMGAMLLACGSVLMGALFLVRSPLYRPSSFRIPPTQAKHSAAPLPHVLWIVQDTVRADRMSCFGYQQPTTPFLSEFSRESIVFENMNATGIWTVPTHASMFTGLSTREHGADIDENWLDEGFLTVAESLRDSGYSTAAFVNNPWLGPGTNLMQGFDVVRGIYKLKHMKAFAGQELWNRWGMRPTPPWLDTDDGAALTNLWATAWLDQQMTQERPVFLFVNYMEAHLPYSAPSEYRRLFMDADEVRRSYALRSGEYGDLEKLYLTYNVERPPTMKASDRAILSSQYNAAIRYLDMRTEELVGAFADRGLLEDTLVVISSDHGEYLGGHEMWAHQCQLFHEVIHVPLVLREPGRRSGVRIVTPVSQSDLRFTILNQTVGQEEFDAPSDSRDLVFLEKEEGSDSRVVSQYRGPGNEIGPRLLNSGDPILVHRALPQMAVFDGRFKYIESENGAQELYDLVADPGETFNLANRHHSALTDSRAYLDSWRAKTPEYTPSGAQQLGKDTFELLKSLGYVSDAE